MSWENGITYSGAWHIGQYHGHGAKTYSKGGGYVGNWRHGKREGFGVSIYGGKWGYDRWEGQFVDDKPHGEGLMYPAQEEGPEGSEAEEGVETETAVPFAFEHGEPRTAGLDKPWDKS